jgi:type IV secretion system protein VirD4
MLKRTTAPIRAVIWLSIPVGLLAAVPLASYAVAEVGGYRWAWWLSLWAAQEYVHHGRHLELAALAGGAALGSVLGIPAFVAFALLPSKPLHGSARLARNGEVARAKLYKAAPHGVVLGKHRGKLLVFNGDLHAFLAAPTGSGKGVGFVVPNLLHWQGSAMVLDIKGENHSLTAGWRASMGQAIYFFNPLQEDGRTHRFNPLAYVREGDVRIADVQVIAHILVPSEGNDPYWTDAARDLFTGLALLVLDVGEAQGWPLTLGQVHRLIRSEQDPAEVLPALIEACEASGHPVSDWAKRLVFGYCNEPEKPRGSIRSTLATKLSLWANPVIDRATAGNDFDVRTLRRVPQTIYLAIAPDDLIRVAPVVRLLIEFTLSANTRTNERPADDPALCVPLLLLLDEFLSLGRMEKLVHALSYVRGWGIKVATVIQSEAQVRALYGQEMAEAFIDNHRARVYFRPPVHRRDLAEQISRTIGTATVKQTSYSYGQGPRSRQVSETAQAVLDADEIAQLSAREAIVLVEGVRPIVAGKLRFYRDKPFRRRASIPAPALPAAPPAAPTAAEASDAPEGLAGWIEEGDGSSAERYETAAELRAALSAIPTAPDGATDELEAMAKAIAEAVHKAGAAALAGLHDDEEEAETI